MTTSSTRSPSATSTHSSPSSRTSTSRARRRTLPPRCPSRPSSSPMRPPTPGSMTSTADRREGTPAPRGPSRPRRLRAVAREQAEGADGPGAGRRVRVRDARRQVGQAARGAQARRGEVRACGRAGRGGRFTFRESALHARRSVLVRPLGPDPCARAEGRRLHHSRAPIDAGSAVMRSCSRTGASPSGSITCGRAIRSRSRHGGDPDRRLDAPDRDLRRLQPGLRGGRLHQREEGRLEVIRDGLVKDITYGGSEPDLALATASATTASRAARWTTCASSTGPSPPWRRPTSRDFRPA